MILLFLFFIFFLQIVDACIRLCQVEPTAGILVGHSEALKDPDTVCQYVYNRSNFKNFTIGPGTYNHTEDDLWSGLVPSECVICFVASEAYSGSLSRNPFHYDHFNVSYISLTVGG